MLVLTLLPSTSTIPTPSSLAAPPIASMQGFNMGRYVPPDQEGVRSGNAIHRKPVVPATIRFEMPYAIWCSTCPKPTIIGQGVRFNAVKKRVGSYHTTPIWSFRFKHAACGGAIEIRTDPQNTAYVVTEGAKKRDTGEDKVMDGDQVVLTDQEREALRKNAFAKLEKTIEDREQIKESKQRIGELLEASDRHWDDPYTQNQRLRRAFRVGRKEREKEALATEDLQDRMSLGIDLLPSTEEDRLRAMLVDFRPAPDNDNDASAAKALAKPLFGKATRQGSKQPKLKEEKKAAKQKATFVAEVMGNTRAATDPFLTNDKSITSTSRLPGVKRKRELQTAHVAGGQSDSPPKKTATPLVEYESDD